MLFIYITYYDEMIKSRELIKEFGTMVEVGSIIISMFLAYLQNHGDVETGEWDSLETSDMVIDMFIEDIKLQTNNSLTKEQSESLRFLCEATVEHFFGSKTGN